MFFSRPIAKGTETPIADHAVIAAAAAVRQARTPTARAAAALDRPEIERGPAANLVSVIRVRGGQRSGGSFHPGIAERW